MAWLNVLQSVFMLPFMAGYAKAGRNRPTHLDGTTSVIVFSTFLFSFILLIAKTMTGTNETVFHCRGFHVILSSIAFIGVLSYIILIITLRLKGFSSLLEQRTARSTSGVHIIFLWMFGVASVVFCILNTGRLIECELSLESNVVSDVNLMECAYYVAMALFLLIQMMVLTYLMPFKFRSSLRLQYLILIIISTNLSMCAYSFRDRYLGDMYVGNGTWIVLNCTNQTFSQMLDVSNKVLTPTFLECSFLSITIIMNMSSKWNTDNTINDNNELTVVIASSDSVSDTNVDNPVSFERRRSQLSGEHNNDTEYDDNSSESNPRTPLLSNSQVSRRGSNSAPGCHTGVKPNKERLKPLLWYYASVLFSWILGIAVLIVYIVQITSESTDRGMLNARDVCETLASCMMAVYVHAGFYLLSKHTRPKADVGPVSGSEYIFIISSIGALFSCVFSVLSFIHFAPTFYKVHVASRVIIGVISYTQTVFILHAKRCRRKRTNENISSLRSVMLLLVMFNFVFWIVESFIYGGYYNVKYMERKYLGPDLWNIRVGICHPLYMYFSFTSALEMYNLFQQFSAKQL
ncbi:uncharacterized protein LOC110458586 [Mizuhopecten yessoensis]|uniref:uncharacterized protein LOC110458586 n=1 Tax=Mizuhopecten yessoensis TaxID=6573 RepID=UPI000B458D7B|nr:uncharacterized protein LOC110458586 [Mizuhopecten yessoensis]